MNLIIKNVVFELNKFTINKMKKYFKISKKEAVDLIYASYANLFDNNCFCKKSNVLLYDTIGLNKNKIFHNSRGWLIKYRYDQKFYRKFELEYEDKLPDRYCHAIIWFIENNIDLNTLVLNDIELKSKELNSGHNSPIGRFKKKRSKEEFEIFRKKASNCVKNTMKIHGNPFGKEFWEKKGLSKEESQKKVNERNKYTVDYWLKKGFSLEEAEQKAIQHNPGSKNNIYNLSPTDFRKQTVTYWVNLGYSAEEAKIKNKEYCVTSKYFWIRKGHNEEEAKKLASLNNSWKYEYWTNKGFTDKEIHKIFSERCIISNGISIESKIVFNKFLSMYPYKNVITPVLTGYEKKIDLFFYDYVDEDYKFIIEYNGSVWHANPRYFKENDTPNPFNKKLTSKEIWDKDKIKNKIVEKFGYKLFIIWDDDDIFLKFEEILNYVRSKNEIKTN